MDLLVRCLEKGPKILPKCWLNGDESHGRIRKTSPQTNPRLAVCWKLQVPALFRWIYSWQSLGPLLTVRTFNGLDVKYHDQLKGTKGIGRSPKMCQEIQV